MTTRQVRHDDTRLPFTLACRDAPPREVRQVRGDQAPNALRAPMIDLILEKNPNAFTREQLEKMTDDELRGAFDGTRAGEKSRADGLYRPPQSTSLQSTSGPFDPRHPSGGRAVPPRGPSQPQPTGLYTPPGRRR